MNMFQAKFPKAHIHNGYGCAEMGSLVAFFRQADFESNLAIKKGNSVGKLCPGLSAIVCVTM